MASKALGLSLRQLAADWQQQHGVRPVLSETYVSQPYAGTCCRASNWHYLGQPQALGAMGAVPAKTPKSVFVYPVYPLQLDWQAILLAPQRPACPLPLDDRLSGLPTSGSPGLLRPGS